jgi:nucleoside-diphosphate-sugar epimerase
MFKVLVLGGDEYIGGRVLEALANCGWALPITSLVETTKIDLKKIELRRFDATNPASLAQVMNGVDAVVNCHSGAPPTIAAAAAALFQVAGNSAAPPLIVHVSSMSVYGSSVGVLGEDAPLRDDLGAYAQAKIEAEKTAMGFARKVILRPGCEYGPGSLVWSGRIAKWLFKRRIGDLGAAGDGYCNLVHIDDLVSAVLLSLRQPAALGQTFNLAVTNPPTWNEYLMRYAKALGAVPVKRISGRSLSLETKVFAVPLKAFEIAAQKTGLTSITRPAIPPSFLALARQDIRLDSSRAKRVLGWDCMSLDLGIAQAAKWFSRGNG